MTTSSPSPLARAATLAIATLTAAACTGTTGQTTSTHDQSVLGTAEDFAVLGGSTVTSTGSTTVAGNLGVHPGLSVTGFPPGLVSGGTIHAGDAMALQAQSDTTIAYTSLAGEAPTADLTGQDLGGKTLTAGVYHFSSSAQLTGTLTLDAQNDPNAIFVFQIGSTLTTASNSTVLVVNGANDCNIFWQVGSSATVGTTTALKGNVLALTSITLTTGATVSGRVLARNGAVTMDTNAVSTHACTALPAPDAGAGQPDGSVGIDAGVDAPAAPDAPATDAGPTDTGGAAAVCGNGIVETGEGCDDGNLDNSDGCDTTCTITYCCGNGILEPNETCDDGNQIDHDGCSSTCTTEL